MSTDRGGIFRGDLGDPERKRNKSGGKSYFDCLGLIYNMLIIAGTISLSRSQNRQLLQVVWLSVMCSGTTLCLPFARTHKYSTLSAGARLFLRTGAAAPKFEHGSHSVLCFNSLEQTRASHLILYLELTGAAVLYERRERGQLQLGVRLQHVAHQVGHLGDVVAQTLAHADPDRVAGHLLLVVAERIDGQEERTDQEERERNHHHHHGPRHFDKKKNSSTRIERENL